MTGYDSPQGDEIKQLFTEIKNIAGRVSELERPTGTQRADALQQIRDLVNGIIAQTNISVSGNVTAGGTVSGGTVTSSGDIVSAGRGTFTGGITSADVRSRTVTVSYSAVYADGSGVLGANTSRVSVKQDFEPADASAEVDALLRVGMLRFRYVDAVDQLGDDAPVVLGSIVEYFARIPALAQYVFTDSEGVPLGIAWEQMVPALIATNQRQQSQIDSLSARLDAAGI